MDIDEYDLDNPLFGLDHLSSEALSIIGGDDSHAVPKEDFGILTRDDHNMLADEASQGGPAAGASAAADDKPPADDVGKHEQNPALEQDPKPVVEPTSKAETAKDSSSSPPRRLRKSTRQAKQKAEAKLQHQATIETSVGGSTQDASAAPESEEEEQYCFCGGRDDGTMMIACDECNEWYHIRCLKLTARHVKALSATSTPFVCPSCKGERDESRT